MKRFVYKWLYHVIGYDIKKALTFISDSIAFSEIILFINPRAFFVNRAVNICNAIHTLTFKSLKLKLQIVVIHTILMQIDSCIQSKIHNKYWKANGIVTKSNISHDIISIDVAFARKWMCRRLYAYVCAFRKQEIAILRQSYKCTPNWLTLYAYGKRCIWSWIKQS